MSPAPRDELTLAALLSHPENGGLTVLTGPTDAPSHPPWTDVVVEVAESDLPDRVTDALAVLIAPAPTATWQLDALLRRVHDRGFTGIVLTGTPAEHHSRRLAERLGLVVLHADQPTQLARACWQLVGARDALTVWAVQRVARSIEYQAHDLGDLLRHVNANIGQGIALLDRAGVLVHAGEDVPEPLLAAISFEARWLDVAETPEGFAVSVPVHSSARHGLRVAIHGRDAGTAQRHAFATAVEVVMPMVAARLLVDEVADVSDVSRSSGLLSDFLDSHGALDADLEARLQARGWRTGGHHLGFRMVGRGRLDSLELLRFVTEGMAAIPADSHATTRGDGVSGWLTFASAPGPGDLTRHVRELHDLHRRAREQFPVATGVGSLEPGATGLFTSLGQAADAARLAADRERSGWFIHIDSLGLEQLLLAWTGGDSFALAAASFLSPLDAADRTTLATYLDHESSTVATADALGLHRNTVTMRIQRIQGMLGIDLTEPETRLAVHLATRIVADPSGGDSSHHPA